MFWSTGVLTGSLIRREFIEEGMTESFPQRDPLGRLVLQHARDQVEQLPVFLATVLEVPLETPNNIVIKQKDIDWELRCKIDLIIVWQSPVRWRND